MRTMTMLLAFLFVSSIASACEPAGWRPCRSPVPQPPSGGYLAFSGAQAVTVANQNGALRYPGRGGWTVEFWVLPERLTARGEAELTILGQASPGIPGRDPWGFRVHTQAFSFRVDGPNGGSHSLLFDMELNRWHHVAGVYTNDRSGRWMEVYVDGRRVQRQRVHVRMQGRDDPVVFGAFARDFGFGSFEGGLDEVRIWSRALGAGEVQRAMAGEVQPDATGLVAWWSFEERSGTVALDRTEHGLHGVLGDPLGGWKGGARAEAPTRYLPQLPARQPERPLTPEEEVLRRLGCG